MVSNYSETVFYVKYRKNSRLRQSGANFEAVSLWSSTVHYTLAIEKRSYSDCMSICIHVLHHMFETYVVAPPPPCMFCVHSI